MAKIAFIGAGSYGFTFKLVVDILSFESLKDSDLVFMDVDKGRLDNLQVIWKAYADKTNCKTQPLFTMNMEEALVGADFVINLVKIGFLEASIQDMDVAKKFGLYQTIGDTCGVAGVFRGLRTMIFHEKLLDTMERVSSREAVVLNYTNPQPSLVSHAAAISNIPFYGLCHSVQGTTQQIARFLGIPYEELRYEAAGINHMSWITTLERDDEDLYPAFIQRVKETGIYKTTGDDDLVLAQLGPSRLDMLQRVGYMVTESSTHFPEYVPFYLRTEELREQYRIPVDQYRENIRRKTEQYEGFVDMARRGELPELSRSVEYGPSMINSMVTGELCRVYANVMNTGLITNLPEDAAVEVACLVDENGVHPCHYGALPPQLAALCQSNVSVHQLAVEAVLQQDRRYIYWALMMDPVTHSMLTLDQIETVVDELVDAQPAYLHSHFG